MSKLNTPSPSSSAKMRVAILGSGNIATDLLIKVLRSPFLECSLFIGRRQNSPGIEKARTLGVPASLLGADALSAQPSSCDLVFDATSALEHQKHWPLLQSLGVKVIDLTPAYIGSMCVPAINLDSCLPSQNINMVTCGGQASIPIAHALAAVHRDLQYIEVVSSISSRSAGPATRINIDEYITATEAAICAFTGAHRAKAILTLNPAEPCIDMQTTIYARIPKPDIQALRAAVHKAAMAVARYVPGYRILVPPTFQDDRVITTLAVSGQGDHLPKYAGNLDIINCAAIAAAEEIARRRLSPQSATHRDANP